MIRRPLGEREMRAGDYGREAYCRENGVCDDLSRGMEDRDGMDYGSDRGGRS